MASPTLLDIAKVNGSDALVGLIDESSRFVPEISGRVYRGATEVLVPNLGYSRTVKGRQYKSLVRTATPQGGFRNANEGSASIKSTLAEINVETFILNPRWECDKAVADSDEMGPQRFIAMEAEGLLAGAMMDAAKSFYYGRGTLGNAKGHPGLINSVDSSMIVDATGSTADTASSVWAVKWGLKNVTWVWGENGMLELSEVRLGDITDGSSNRYTAYIQEIMAYPGLQVGHKYACGQIKNLTAQTGKGLTDALLGTLYSRFPIGMQPDCFLMSRRSNEQLRASRTATNATGTEAAIPTEWNGVPIVTTDSILDTEAIV